MARVPNTTRVVLSGTLPNGEIFQTGFWMSGVNITSEATATAAAADFASTWSTVAAGYFAAFLPASSAYTTLTVYHYVATTGGATYQAQAPITGGTGTGAAADALPLQTCVVLTLLTGLSGRRRRGRMYFPMLNSGLPSHQLGQEIIDQLCDLLASFFSNINAGAGQVIVHSQVGAGSTATVTMVTCDSETDVQRRRANRQTELRQADAVVTNS